MVTIDSIKNRISNLYVADPRDLLLCKMTHEEAKVFAGTHGMNAIILNTKNSIMDMVRLENDKNDTLVASCNRRFGPNSFTLTEEYDIYWIGSKK